MDSARGHDSYSDDDGAAARSAPIAIGGDERRMHVRAYNHWASLLGGRPLPSIADLDPQGIADFGANSVLLDFTQGMEDPKIVFLGRALREECGLDASVNSIAGVPARSLLSRLTDHYLQIIANRAPVGFEAEFVNTRAHETMYRGILMPFSSHGDTIDFVYGVINWKEMVAATTQSVLEDEVAAALAAPAPQAPSAPVWADGPSAQIADEITDGIALSDRLGSARATALAATAAQRRADEMLHRALGEAHDLALAALRDPAAFAGIRGQTHGSTVRAVAVLVFGDDRTEEFTAALDHARAEGVPEAAFAQYLAAVGGLPALIPRV